MRRQRFLLFRIYRYQDSDAYAELYDIYYERIKRFVFFKLPKPHVEELTAEVFLRGWEYMTASSVDNAAALFYRIARNLIADHYRSNKLSEVSIDDTEIESKQNIQEEVQFSLNHTKLLTALKALKEEYRDVLIMRHLDEMSVKEIAGALDKTSNNVRVLLHRAKQALKQQVQ